MAPDSIAVYTGLLLALAGIISLVRPIRALRIRSRRSGALVAAAGLVLAAAAFAWPAGDFHAAARASHLDEFMPAWQFAERHQTDIAAPPEQVHTAIRAVTADEIVFFQLLTWIRRGGRSGPENILNAPGGKPLLDVATSTSFTPLADDPRELVVGTLIRAPEGMRASRRLTAGTFGADAPPGVVLAAMNFRIEPLGTTRTRLTTETRVRAGDAQAARRFAVYWRLIHPGSALIRRMWLRAIKIRAEGEG